MFAFATTLSELFDFIGIITCFLKESFIVILSLGLFF